jgi:CRP-like cAMP-binding protein
MQAKAPVRRRNAVLDHVSDKDFAQLEPLLQPVELTFRKLLQSSNRKIDTVYFPESGLASVVAIGGGERKQAEVAIIGREGFVGIPVALGAERSPHDIFMQIEGQGHSVPAHDFRELLHSCPSLLRTCLQYVHVYTVQAAHTALANARGSIEGRLARWLLMAEDRVGGPELHLTHDFLALMLGVRRAGVTVGLKHFERQGQISAARGAITILDRDGLVESANGLYGGPESEFERLFTGARTVGDELRGVSLRRLRAR